MSELGLGGTGSGIRAFYDREHVLWTMTHRDAGTLRVRYSLQRIEGKLTMVQPKAEHGRRTIDLPPPAPAALRAHRVRQLQEQLIVGIRWNEQGLIFTTQIGTPLEKGNVLKWFHVTLE